MSDAAKEIYTCPSCSKRIRAPANRSFRCPVCGGDVEPVDAIPMPELAPSDHSQDASGDTMGRPADGYRPDVSPVDPATLPPPTEPVHA